MSKQRANRMDIRHREYGGWAIISSYRSHRWARIGYEVCRKSFSHSASRELRERSLLALFAPCENSHHSQLQLTTP